MLMTKFDEWRAEHTENSEANEDNFSIFFQYTSFDLTFVEMLVDLAYQVYELQIVVDGLIEDSEE